MLFSHLHRLSLQLSGQVWCSAVSVFVFYEILKFSDQSLGGIIDLGQQGLDLLLRLAGASKVMTTFLVSISAFTDWTPASSLTSVSIVCVQCPQEIAGTV